MSLFFCLNDLSRFWWSQVIVDLPRRKFKKLNFDLKLLFLQLHFVVIFEVILLESFLLPTSVKDVSKSFFKYLKNATENKGIFSLFQSENIHGKRQINFYSRLGNSDKLWVLWHDEPESELQMEFFLMSGNWSPVMSYCSQFGILFGFLSFIKYALLWHFLNWNTLQFCFFPVFQNISWSRISSCIFK